MREWKARRSAREREGKKRLRRGWPKVGMKVCVPSLSDCFFRSLVLTLPFPHPEAPWGSKSPSRDNDTFECLGSLKEMGSSVEKGQGGDAPI